MDIKILGPGCMRCKKLEEMTRETLTALGRSAYITHVTDVATFSQYSVMTTPALVVDGVVLVQGRLPRPQELEEWLRTA